MEKRIITALQFLKDGQSFTVGDLRLDINGSEMTVIGWSNFLNFSNISKASSIKELMEIKDIFASMLSISVDLTTFVSDKTIKYMLCYDDGGKSSIEICYEKDNVIHWIYKIS